MNCALLQKTKMKTVKNVVLVYAFFQKLRNGNVAIRGSRSVRVEKCRGDRVDKEEIVSDAIRSRPNSAMRRHCRAMSRPR